MAAFFKNPAPPGSAAPRIADRPRLVRAWRIGDDGRLRCCWTAETAEILPFTAASPATPAPAAPHRGQAA